MSPSRAIIGWDLGGAHLKAALLGSDGRLLRVALRPAPVWQGLEHLDTAVRDLAADLPLDNCEHYLTMTGELVDLFDNRAQGVVELADFFAGRVPAGELRLYAGPLGFVDVASARALHANIASANWYATAAWLAATQAGGILVDAGSTTVDLSTFQADVVSNRGYSDRERLACQELVYTGVVRTPVMAVAQRVPFAGEWLALANEHFATMADVYRILELLPEGADLYPSADGRDQSIRSSMRRLARMIGADLEDGDPCTWYGLAEFIAERQLDDLAAACWRHFSRGVPRDAALYGAGVGRFLVRRLAQRLRREYVDIDTLLGHPEVDGVSAAVCAPAVAIARLAAMQRLACAC